MVMKIDDIMLEGYGATGKKERPYGEKYTSGLYRLKNKVLRLKKHEYVYLNIIQLLNLKEYYLEANLEYFLKQIKKIEDTDNQIKDYSYEVYKTLKSSKYSFKNILSRVFVFINYAYDEVVDFISGKFKDVVLNLLPSGINMTIKYIIPTIINQFFDKIFSLTLKDIPKKILKLIKNHKLDKDILSEMNTVVYDLKRLSKDDSDGVLYFDLRYELMKNYYPESFRVLLSELGASYLDDNSTLSVDDQKELGVTFYESWMDKQ